MYYDISVPAGGSNISRSNFYPRGCRSDDMSSNSASIVFNALISQKHALINPPRPFPEKDLCPVNTASLQHITLDFRVSYFGHGCRELLQECHWRRAKVADSIIWRHGECSCCTSYATVRGLLYIILLHRKSGIHCE
jgi:hypothetical protein